MVVPSMPGYGFSGKPTRTGWDPVRMDGRRQIGSTPAGGGVGSAQAPRELLLPPPPCRPDDRPACWEATNAARRSWRELDARAPMTNRGWRGQQVC